MFNKLVAGNLLAFTLIASQFTLTENVSAQSTWSDVHAILQTSCGSMTGGCHEMAASHPLKLIGTESFVYNNIVNANPINPSAIAAGYKLVDPGYPHQSFLLKKVNDSTLQDPDNGLDNVAQGKPMPYSSPPLSPEDIDLINAWILYGAPQTGTVVDAQLISDYHNIGGLAHADPFPAPAPADGFQIHYGSIFMAPNTEKEFFLKRKLPNLTEEMEITRLETYIDFESHHYIIYKFDTQADADAEPEGLKEVTGFQDAFINGTSMIAAWQNASDIVLPLGTAYFWEANTTLDLNLHIRNYSLDSILKAEVYTNVYMKPKQTSTTEMISDLFLFSQLPTFGASCSIIPPGPNKFCIPADGVDISFTGVVNAPSQQLNAQAGDSMYVWLLSSHTHKYGKGFNIYLRNPGGPNDEKGAQVYDGFYNFDYTFNQGFYDFEDPAVRFFDLDTFVIKASDGFVQGATFNNYGTQDVGFGITTNDEMMLMFLQYTTERRTPPAIALSIASTPTAQGTCDGTATATATGGLSPFTYLWDDLLAQGTQIATGLCPGDYTVLMTDNTGSTVSATVTVDALTGVATYVNNMTITVYPNPSSGNTPVSFIRDNTKNEVYLTLYDLLGKEVLVQQFPAGSRQLFLDKSQLKAGVYLYKAWSDKGDLASGKLVMY